MKIIKTNHPSGFGHIYYVEAIDTDSARPAWVKVWDSRDIPARVIARCLAEELETGHEGRELKLVFNKV